MQLCLDLLSPPRRGLYPLAEALRIPDEFRLLDLLAGQQNSEEKLKLVKKAPVLKASSCVLSESIAILQYLLQKCSVADHWFPAELQQRAAVNEYLSRQHLTLRSHCSKVFLLRIMHRPLLGSEAPKEKLDVSLEDMKQSLDLLEEKFLQDKPLIVGNKISVADVVEVMQPVGVGVDPFQSRPTLTAWRERVKKELGVKVFDQAHEALLNSSDLQQKMQNNTELQKLKPMFLKYFS